MNFIKLRKEILSKAMNVNDLYQYRNDFLEYSMKIINKKKYDILELENFLILCLDYYVFSDQGLVLIPDHNYDMCMREYTKTKDLIIYADDIMNITKWEFVDHKIPGLVGSLDKIYTYEELKDYLYENRDIHSFILAPKYDGISAAVEVEKGNIVRATTRYDGIKGQDITKIVRNSDTTLLNLDGYTGYYKCELCVSLEDFDKLIQEKKYMNRRSATSGIVNSPKNVILARYITALPLLKYKDGKIDYTAPLAKMKNYYSARDMMDDIESLMKQIKDKDFPYRTDGVVIYPVSKNLSINPNDFMSHAIAYKMNTSEGITKIRYGYMSVGRLGNAIPMLKVEPVEVNETIVEDVSLGSYDKFLSMNLIEGEEVVIYSAGDVIPQVKMPKMRTNFLNKPELKIPKICPYCNSKLKRYGSEYKCKNPDCIRVNTGRIANFLDKMGVENFSDKTVEQLYSAGLIKKIEDLFSLTVEDLMRLDGFERTSSTKLIEQIDALREKPIGLSKLFGALGITNISDKKCRKMFETIEIEYLLKKKKEKVVDRLIQADGIGIATAEIFYEFVDENRDLIEYLLKILNVTDDTVYYGTIVFTGFRDKEWEDKFRALGYEVTDSVTSKTITVVSNSMNHNSTKCKAAIQKGIPIINRIELEEYYEKLKRYKP